MGNSSWFNKVNRKYDNILSKIEKKYVRKCRLELLKKVINRVEEFSVHDCEQCEKHKLDIDQMFEMLEQNGGTKPIDLKEYNAISKGIINHLKKDHGLVEEGTYLGQWLGYGMIIGALFMIFSTTAISIGMLFGIAIGSMFDADAKKKGKQI